MAKTYSWTGVLGTDFATPGNWDDISDATNPSATAPAAGDTAEFFKAATVTGSRTVGTLQVGAALVLAADLTVTALLYDTADLTVSGTLNAAGLAIYNNASNFIVDGSGVVTAAFYNQANNADLQLQSGAQVTLTGMAGGYLPSALTIDSTSTTSQIDGATLTATGGSVNIGGNLGVDDGALVSDLVAYVNSHTLTISGVGTEWHDVGSSEVVNGTTYTTGQMGINGAGFPSPVLILTDDATLTDDTGAFIGNGGAAEVSDGAIWTLGTQGVNLGDTGSGTLSVTGGGTLTSLGSYDLIGNVAGGSGFVTVDGAKSVWDSAGLLVIGNSGAGNFTATDTATVTVGKLAVAQLTGSTGTLTIGSGAIVNTTGSGYGAIEVGNLAGSTGVVDIEAGGTLEETGALDPNDYSVAIGANSSSTNASGDITPAANGAIYVEGAGALFTITNGNALQIGNGGTGLLSVTGGASVNLAVPDTSNTSALSVAYSGTGTGTVIVNGAGSTLTVTGEAYFAHSGTATLRVTNNGTFLAGDTAYGLYLGLGNSNGTGGSATATVASGGYIKSAQDLSVGEGGDTATLNITGGTVEADGKILIGITNTVGSLEVGGTGFVTVGAGGTLLADGGDITASSTSDILVGSGAGSTGTLTVSGAGALVSAAGHFMTIGNQGASGYVSVTQAGTVETGIQPYTTASTNSALNIGTNGGEGWLTVSGSLSTYNAAGQVNVGNTGIGHLEVEAGGTLLSGNNTLVPSEGLVIGRTSTGSGDVAVTGAGSEIVNVGRFVVGGASSGSTLAGGLGLLTVSGGGLVKTSLPASGATGPAADIAATTGTDGSGVTVTGAGSTWQVGGTLLVGDAAAGQLSIDAGGTVTATQLDVGVQTTGSGEVSMAGASTLAVAAGVTIGDATSGNLSIDAGALVTAASLTIGAQTTGAGFVDLSGAGSTLDVSGALTVGGLGNAELSIGPGASVIAGTLAVGLDGVITQLGGELDPPTTIANAGIIGGHGIVDANVDNAGTLYAQGGTEEVKGAVTDTGALDIDNAGNLQLDGAVGAGQTVDFTTANGTLTLEDPADFAGTIEGFHVGDLIVAAGATGGALSGDLLSLTDAAGVFAALAFVNPPADLAVAPDGDVMPCFLAGTSLRTDGGETPVEALVVGDLVLTAAGGARPIRWIGHRTVDCRRHPRPQQAWPVRISAGAFGGGQPIRDLLLSPEHAVHVDDVLVPIRCLVNGATIAQEARDSVTYYHIELDRHDVILAEGLPCESYLDAGNRAMFANCRVTDLHPSFARSAEHVWMHDACAPLLETGPRLDDIRARLNARAGLAVEDPSVHQAGELRGWIDVATHAVVRGWAWQPEHPGHFVRLEILDGDTVLGEVIATEQRNDVRDAGRLEIMADGVCVGHGDGRCGFTFRLTQDLSPFLEHTIRVRRRSDGVGLWNSGQVSVAAAGRLDAPVLDAFLAALNATAAVASDAERAALLGFMKGAADQLQTVRARGDDRRPLALFIDEARPDPERDSASQVALDHMRSLQALGYRVAFAAIEPAAGDTARLQAPGVEDCLPAMGSVEDMLRRLGPATALVYLHRVRTASLYGALARHHCPQALLVYSVADLHFVRTARQALLEGSVSRAAESRRLRERELLAAGSADRVITHSDAEAVVLRQHLPSARVHVVPWSIAARAVSVPFGQRCGLAFIGSYRHAPNVDAARWLMEEIMPLVWAAAPEIECLLVGSHMPDALRVTRSGILPLGHVADLATIFDRVRLTVAPLRFGAGVKGKVLHSLAAGVPCAVTPIAAEGLALPPLLRHGVGTSAGELARQIIQLHGDAPHNAACAAAGVSLIRDGFTTDRIDGLMRETIGAGSHATARGERCAAGRARQIA